MPWPVWLWWDWPLWFTCCRQWGLYGTYVCTWWPRSKQATDPYYRHKYEQTTIRKVNWSNDVGFKSCMLIIIVCLTVVRHSLKTYFHVLKITGFEFFLLCVKIWKKTKRKTFFSTSHEHGASPVPSTPSGRGILPWSAPFVVCLPASPPAYRNDLKAPSPTIPRIACQYGVLDIFQSFFSRHTRTTETNKCVIMGKIAVTLQWALRRHRQLDCLFNLLIA